MTDYYEVTSGLDPFSAVDGPADSDWDGLLNFEEALAGTKPTWTDSDEDGVDDYFETMQGSDPNSAADGGRVPSGVDFVGIKLFTRDKGKVNNGQNRAVCQAASPTFRRSLRRPRVRHDAQSAHALPAHYR